MKTILKKNIGMIAFAGFLLIFGLIGIIEAVQITIWEEYLPGPGFMLLICAAAMILFTILWIVPEIRKNAKTDAAEKAEQEGGRHLCKLAYIFGLPAAGAAAVFAMNYLGLVLVMTLGLLTWFKFGAKKKWITSILLTVIIMAVLYAVFILWLQMPVPTFLGII